jgi:type I restriction-modification system DNA methylase subunit
MAATAPATLATFKEELSRLVAHFSSQQPYFTGPDYNEAKLREDFLNPLFAALGWDVGNRKGLIHTEREVDIEVRTEISGKQKRADYVFRIARLERLTCEAKKPAETLHNGHAYQAKRDAYARGIPFTLLSDFEEMRFYVVGARPHRSEPVTAGQWKHLHFSQYLDSAAELWDLLAYENVAAGSIDRLIDGLPKRATRLKARQGYLIRPDRTKSLDAEFLNFLDAARQRLGSDLLKNNDRDDLLSGNRLNEAAQRILDRLVFLRICEDRGIDTGTLLSTQLRDWYHHQDARPRLKRGAFDARKTSLFPDTVDEEPPSPRYAPPAEGGLYRVFVAHVRALDQRPPSYQPFFNGQLFKPHFSEDLVVGDEWLANFIDDLTADDEGYNFADIKVEILGDAYERFLGKVLRPQGRGATIEEKPEVRKAGGVYYTPRYIVDYIVEQTVGRQLEGKLPAQVAKLRFLDPACGSGSFLIRVYERVMEHHLRHFTQRVREFQERATLENTPLEKLLRPHREDYYLDAAGNVRLTTRLKRQILQNNVFGVDIDAQAVEVTQLSLYLKMLEGENRESLHHQTKDLFNKEALLPPLDQNIKCGNSLIGSDFSLDPAELVRVNAFDWDIGFEKIMNAGGFDAVVGNPPYIPIEMMAVSEREHYGKIFPQLERKFDTSVAFIISGARLLKTTGLLGYISSTTWETGENYGKLRQHMFTKHGLTHLINLPFDIFEDAYVETCVYIISAKPSSEYHIANLPKKQRFATLSEVELTRVDSAMVRAPDYRLVLNPAAETLSRRLSDPALFVSLGEITKSTQGLAASRFERQAIKPKGAGWYPFGEKCQAFRHQFVLEQTSFANMAEMPSLKQFYEAEPKVVIRRVINRQDRLDVAYVDEKMVFKKDLNPFIPTADGVSAKSLACILNSKLLSYLYISSSAIATKDDFRQTTLAELRRLPIPRSASEAPVAKKFSDLADKMRSLYSSDAKSDTERAAIQNAIRKTDRDIDQLVYQLYGLTPEEIALVEGTAEPAEPVEAPAE